MGSQLTPSSNFLTFHFRSACYPSFCWGNSKYYIHNALYSILTTVERALHEESDSCRGRSVIVAAFLFEG